MGNLLQITTVRELEKALREFAPDASLVFVINDEWCQDDASMHVSKVYVDDVEDRGVCAITVNAE